jgi:tetratricopeptide (TPR) repeat protein
MVLAGPSDQANLALKQEAQALEAELKGGDGVGELSQTPIELTILEQPGREQLTQTLEQGKYQIFHFAGHSNQGPAVGQLHLVNTITGLTESLTGDDLAGLLVNNGVWLAVLNSCLGTQAATAALDGQEGDRSLAAALIRQGIPSVLAMAERIPDRVALTLSRLFYRNLKLGYSLDLSLGRARQGLISAYGSHQLYWALPVLHLHSEFAGQLVRQAKPEAIPQAHYLGLSPSNSTVPKISMDHRLLDDNGDNNGTDAKIPSEIYGYHHGHGNGRHGRGEASNGVGTHLPVALCPDPSVNLENPSDDRSQDFRAMDQNSMGQNSSSGDLDREITGMADDGWRDDDLGNYQLGNYGYGNLRFEAENYLENQLESQAGDLASLVEKLSNLPAIEEEKSLNAAHGEILLPEAEQTLELYPDLPLGFSQPGLTGQGPMGQGHGEGMGLPTVYPAVVPNGEMGLGENLDLMAQGAVESSLPPVQADGLSTGLLTELSMLESENPSIARYRETIALNPTDSNTYYQLGQVLFEQGEGNLAIDAYHQALSLNPNFAAAYSGLGRALAQQGRYGNAIVAYRQALALNPHLPDTYRDLSQALARQGQLASGSMASGSMASGSMAPERSLGESSPSIASQGSKSVQRSVQGSTQPIPLPIPGFAPATKAAAPQGFSWSLPLWAWLGLTGAVATATLSLLIATGPKISTPVTAGSTGSTSGVEAIDILKSEDRDTQEQNYSVTAAVTAQAIQSFNQGDVAVAQDAVAALLDRSALREAQTALDVAFDQQIEDPRIIFLQGRLAWQAVQTGNRDFSVDDARRFWETAIQGQAPISHLNALAFAYYTEGNLVQAKEMWFEVLTAKDRTTSPAQILGAELKEQEPDALMAYAGLALVLLKSAEAQPIAQQDQFLNQARRLHQVVIEGNPALFSTASLAEDWLWTEGAIEEWQRLGKLAGVQS